MSINAIVKAVVHKEDGSGWLELEGEERGVNRLHFTAAPHDVTCLNGRQIWGGDSSILVGQQEIAKRVGYGSIKFTIPDFRDVIFND